MAHIRTATMTAEVKTDASNRVVETFESYKSTKNYDSKMSDITVQTIATGVLRELSSVLSYFVSLRRDLGEECNSEPNLKVMSKQALVHL